MFGNECICGYKSDKTCNFQRHRNKCRAYSVSIQKDSKIIKLQDENKYLKNMLASIQSDKANESMKENLILKDKILQLTETLANERKDRQKITIIFPYGQEPPLDKTKVLPLLKQPSESISKYFQLKHFDRTNSRNLRLGNIRSNTIQLFQTDTLTGEIKWTHVDKRKTLSDIAESNIDELREEYNAEKVELWREWYYGNKLNEDGFDKQPEWKALLGKMERVLMNNRFEI